MTDIPMTPDREQEIRTLDLLELVSDRVGAVIGGHLVVLLAEVDRLRAELEENEGVMRALRRQRDAAESRLAATERLAEEARDKGNRTVDTDLLLDALRLDGAPADEAADLAQALANLDAMRADHPGPCRVPDSPDCTCPVEYGIATDNEYGKRVLDPSPDRAESLVRLARCQQMWPNSRLVQRTVSNGEWTEVAP